MDWVPLAKDTQVVQVTAFSRTRLVAVVEQAVRAEMESKRLRRTPVQLAALVVQELHPAFRERRRTTAAAAAAVCTAQSVRAGSVELPGPVDRAEAVQVP